MIFRFVAEKFTDLPAKDQFEGSREVSLSLREVLQ